ncbi:sensor histidine kinase [Paenibacillus sp. CC-CFT747]|nr:sensor histidine kinase [Paenibacillus sp. CC-CFT747]
MSILRFLRYEWPYLFLYGGGLFLTVAVVYAESPAAISWTGIPYLLMLHGLLLAAFVAFRYGQAVKAIRLLGEEDHEPMSMEAEAYGEVLEAREREHILELNEMQEKQREYHDFIVSWFHEIKTPISVLRLMQQTEVDKAGLEQELSRIEHYVDQALYYAKLDSFSQDYRIVPCELEPLVKEIVKARATAFISRRIRLQLDVGGLTVQSDPKWLRFIVDQLVSNSLKYTSAGGTVRITGHSASDEKQLILRDSGIGIDPEDLPRIFNRGFTGANGRSFSQSTGMGLYLAQELSVKLGHYLTCSSVPGEHTEIRIHFPKNSDRYLDTLRSGKDGGRGETDKA